LNQIRKRLTYANVMSSIAVFLLLGGATAFAAGNLGKNTVGTKQLKKNAVTAAKIKNGAVTGAKVKAHSLTASAFAAGQIPAGQPGPAGPAGKTGPAGKDAFGELVYVQAEEENPNNAQSYVEADCPSGYHVTGGGIYGSEGSLGQNINSSYPVTPGTEGEEFGNSGWAGWVNNESGSNASITAFAVCAKTEKTSGP
jgi:hypothetical protein